MLEFAAMRTIFWSGVLVFFVTASVLGADVIRQLWLFSWWIDVVEHLFGGILAGLIGVWWALLLIKRASLVHAIVGAFILGLLVELVEYYVGVGINVHMSRSMDFIKDMAVDLVGGYAAWRYARRFI